MANPRRRRLGGLPLAGLALVAATAARGSEQDPHSFGNPEQVRVTRVDLELKVDFQGKRLVGSATLAVRRPEGATEDAPLVLDTRDLRIERVEVPGDPAPAQVPFALGRPDPILGAPLTINLPAGATEVRITYQTSPGATALQWVEPEGTAGREHPFLYSQSQAIHARSWIPVQDSPGVRVAYSARIDAPTPLVAVMSAERGTRAEAEDRTTTRFNQPHPIPPYLIALAVGDLEFRETGPRTGVWAEPTVVAKAAEEFADTGSLVAAAERICGPYRWGRYDLLVLPPSFPFGGMENAMLTFVTPTSVVGDKSQVPLIAHELAHSWAGNLVTNASWRDFWLNEGVTTYLEHRIIEAVFGPDRADMVRVIDRGELQEDLDRLDARDEVLHIDLSGRDPDEGVTRVPYVKGALFLTLLERTFGRDRFDAFLRGYFDHFAFRSITTADFEVYLREHLFAADPEAARRIDPGTWLHEPGLPDDAPVPRSDRFAARERQADDWLAGRVAAEGLQAEAWSTPETLHFLRVLPDRLPSGRMEELDAALNLTATPNAEIADQWLLMAVRNGYAPADARLEAFLTTIGRRKYLMPLYEALAATPSGKARARAIFAKARSAYHPIAVETVAKLLDVR